MSNEATIPFDQYQRYGIAARAIERIRKDGQPLTILEVGANTHKLLGRLLPNDRIVFLDREIPEEMRDQEDIVVGDATELDLPDGSFDVVIALDVFEHIPADKREAFLRHTTRIARLATIIAAPFDEPGVRAAEREAQAFWQSIFGYPHRWLAEHEQSGLPELGWTTSKIGELGLACLVVRHGELKSWTQLITANFAKEYVPSLGPIVAELDRHYQEVLFDRDFPRDGAYRQFIFISREPTILKALEGWGEASSPDEHDLEGGLFAAIVSGLPAVATEVAAVARTVAERERQVAGLQAQLNEILQSKSWRLTKPFRHLRRMFGRRAAASRHS